MKFSLTSLRVSVAGAKLSYLVQKDRIWDHGSMVEQVRTVFLQLQKALCQGKPESIRKYMTVSGFQRLKADMERSPASTCPNVQKDASLVEVVVIGVHPGNGLRPDQFKALLKGRATDADENAVDEKRKDKLVFEEQWLFVRQGDWWVLDKRSSDLSG